jgi:hypothetical protein
MRLKSVGLFSSAILLSATIIGAQQFPISSGETVAPSFVGVSSSDVGGRRLMKFSGILRDPSGRPLSGVGGLTFAIYRDHEGGAPLWQESQTVQVDAQGNFSVLLGSTTDGGFPLDILSPDEPRWLGVRTQLPQGEEQARLLLVSVPYALKAADADTLGGKPASAYLLAPPEGSDSRSLERTSGSRSAKSSESSKLKTTDTPASFAVSGTGSVDRVTKWSDTSGTLVDSSITDTGSKVGIGTANPLVNFDTKIGTDQHVGIQTISSTPTVIYLNDANSYTTGRIEASALSINAASGGNVGIGTANPLVNFDTKVGTNQHVAIQTIASTPTLIYLNDSSSYTTGRIEALALSINTASGGNVGIGTANPLVNFDTKVGTNQHVGIQTIASSPTLIYLNDSNSYTTGRIEASALSINAASGGNVGIGTTTPGSKLDVAGRANATTLSLPATGADGTTGVLTVGGSPFLHNFGNSTFLGTNAGNFQSNRSVNTGIGSFALSANTIGSYNTATGASALQSNTTGDYNTANGAYALNQNTMGGGNTATGAQAMFYNTTGVENTASGGGALFHNTTGSGNTATGYQPLTFNTTGSNNTASGAGALENNETGSSNTASGLGALSANVSGNNNTALGYSAGAVNPGPNQNTTGSFNTFIGFQAGPGTSTQLNNATAIGANASVSANNTLVLGDPSVSVAIGADTAATKLQVVGDIRVGTSGTNGCVQGFNGGAIAGTCSSDVRLKQNIEPLSPVLDQLIQLQPVSYEWKADEYPEYHFGPERTTGLIAQEVEKVFPGMVATDERGYKAVNYSQLPLLLLQALRELNAENNNLRLEMEAQRRQFQSRLDAIENSRQLHSARGKQ